MKFLTFLFFFFLALWFAGLVMRAVFARWLAKKSKEFSRAANNARRQRGSRPVGHVTVEAAPRVKKVNKTVGEYVDFEEVAE